jgi:hypothetical protein
LCTSGQTVTLPRVRIVLGRVTTASARTMLFIVGVIIVLTTAVIIPKMRLPHGLNSANLGWMSQQWLAEHRASHSV